MKQTAVEWFFWKLYILKEVEYESIMQLYEQAKAMEKEQLCYFYVKGAEAETNNPYVTNIEFYNQTFNS